LLGLVTKTARLVWTGWAGSTVDDVQLSKLYYALSAKFNECIAETPMMSTIFQFACPRTEIRSIEVDRLMESSFFFLSYLPASYTEKESKHIRLLLLLDFLEIFESTHLQWGQNKSAMDLKESFEKQLEKVVWREMVTATIPESSLAEL
jgi:hypothetical protein